jgi:hypothetical protein
MGNLRFIDKCPTCRKIRYGRRDPQFRHLIQTVCQNPFCNFRTVQTYHENDYIIENNILTFIERKGVV